MNVGHQHNCSKMPLSRTRSTVLSFYSPCVAVTSLVVMISAGFNPRPSYSLSTQRATLALPELDRLLLPGFLVAAQLPLSSSIANTYMARRYTVSNAVSRSRSMGFVVDTVAPSTRPNCVAPTMAGMFTVISTALVSGNCANSNEPPLIVGIMTSGVTASGRLLRASRRPFSPPGV